MTLEQAVEALNNIKAGDQEMAHSEADDIILKFLTWNGDAKVANAWLDVYERVGGFWYA